MKRYIADGVHRMNLALNQACVKTEFRIVGTRELPAIGWQSLSYCGAATPCNETVLSREALSDLFARNVTTARERFDMMSFGERNFYRADIIATIYHHSLDWEAGSAVGNYLISPLQMKIPCGPNGTETVEDADAWFELQHLLGHILGAPDNACSQVTPSNRTLMSDPDLTEPPTNAELGVFCKPRELLITPECANVMNAYVPTANATSHTKVRTRHFVLSYYVVVVVLSPSPFLLTLD